MIWVLTAHIDRERATQMIWVPYTPFEMGCCSDRFDASLHPNGLGAHRSKGSGITTQMVWVLAAHMVRVLAAQMIWVPPSK